MPIREASRKGLRASTFDSSAPSGDAAASLKQQIAVARQGKPILACIDLVEMGPKGVVVYASGVGERQEKLGELYRALKSLARKARLNVPFDLRGPNKLDLLRGKVHASQDGLCLSNGSGGFSLTFSGPRMAAALRRLIGQRVSLATVRRDGPRGTQFEVLRLFPSRSAMCSWPSREQVPPSERLAASVETIQREQELDRSPLTIRRPSRGHQRLSISFRAAGTEFVAVWAGKETVVGESADGRFTQPVPRSDLPIAD